MIDPDKTYRTRDGREVRIYAVDGSDDFPVHGAFRNKYGWKLESWPASGRWGGDCDDGCDLIEVKPRIKREVWVNVYLHYQTVWFSEGEAHAAHEGSRTNRIACVKLTIDCEEGEGL